MEILYTREKIQERNILLASQIVRDYPKNTRLLVIGVLRGAYHFMSDLTRAISDAPENIGKQIQVEDDFTTVSTHRGGLKSGELKMVMDVNTVVRGRDLLVLDDIADSRVTLKFLFNYYRSLGANSINAAVAVRRLLSKPVVDAPEPKYVGFDFNGEQFLVGYGLDDKHIRRNLPDIYMLEPDDLTKYEQEMVVGLDGAIDPLA